MRKKTIIWILVVVVTNAGTFFSMAHYHQRTVNLEAAKILALESVNQFDFHSRLADWMKDRSPESIDSLLAFNRITLEVFLEKIELAKSYGAQNDFLSEHAAETKALLSSLPTMEEIEERMNKRRAAEVTTETRVPVSRRIVLPENLSQQDGYTTQD